MFEQSLLPSGGKTGWKKAAAVVISTMFQVTLVMVLLVMPLVFPEAMPQLARKAIVIVTLPRDPDPPEPPTLHPTGGSVPRGGVLFPVDPGHPLPTPSGPPTGMETTSDLEPPPCLDCRAGSVVGVRGLGPGVPWGLPNGDFVPPPPPPPPARVDKQPSASPIRVGTIDPAKLEHYVPPQYPPPARQMRIQGRVTLECKISKTGAIEELRVVSGHPFLIQAALDAVKQWRYKPTYLNREPVEVIATIEVNFTLSQ